MQIITYKKQIFHDKINIMDMNFIKTKLNTLKGDIFGGINAAIIALPQALAFGVATGFGATAGIWGAVILSFIVGILGTSIPMISGITGPSAIVIASVMHALNKDLSAVILIMFMAGLIQIILSRSRLLNVVKYVPYPVISGFMNGVGIIIIILQLNPLLGLTTKSNTIESIEYTILNLGAINKEALILGVITLLIVFGIPKRINKIFPSTVLALIVCTIISIKTGMSVDKISAVTVDMPKIIFPHASIHDIITYFSYAMTLAIILTSESLLTGLVCDSITKIQSSPQRIILAQGVGNTICALTGTLSGAAATMRTVAAIKAGATTRLAALITPVVLLLLLFKFSNFVSEIPLAVLAGILIKIGYDIIDTKLLKVIKLAPKEDLYVLILVFLLTVFYNLIVAVGAGITLAALLYAKRVADKARIVHKVVHNREILTLEKDIEKNFRHKIRIAHIDGQFFFGSATQLISKFDVMLGTKILILNYDANDMLDISAIFALEDIIERLKSQHIHILMVVSNEAVLNQLREYKIIEQIGTHHIFDEEIKAIDFARKAIKRMP